EGSVEITSHTSEALARSMLRCGKPNWCMFFRFARLDVGEATGRVAISLRYPLLLVPKPRQAFAHARSGPEIVSPRANGIDGDTPWSAFRTVASRRALDQSASVITARRPLMDPRLPSTTVNNSEKTRQKQTGTERSEAAVTARPIEAYCNR